MLAGPLVMGLVLMVDPWAKHVEWSGGAAVELRGGFAPPQPGAAAVPAIRLSLSPQGTLTYEDRVRGRQVSFDYTPTVFFSGFQGKAELSQIPNRPLLFHRATLRYAGLLSRRWSWQGNAGASIGEQDYSLQSGGLVQGDGTTDASNPTQGRLLDKPVITTGGVNAGVGVTGRLTPLHTIALGPSVSVQRRLDEPSPNDPASSTFDQTSADLVLSHAWLASRVDTVGSSILGGYADFGESNGSQAYGSGDLTWRRRLRPRLESQLLGGVFFTQQVRARQTTSTVSDGSRAVPLLPVVNVALTGRLLERSRLRLSSEINLGSRTYFDPVLGSVVPLAGGGVGFSAYLPPDVTVGVSGTFYTPPLPPNAVDVAEASSPASTRTTLSVRAPVTYQIDRNYAVEAGTIINARGPHLGVDGPSGRFPQLEFWLYVSFRARYSTARGV